MPGNMEGTEKVPLEIQREKNSQNWQFNGLRLAYLQQRAYYLSNIARKRACAIIFAQALNLSVVFQCPCKRSFFPHAFCCTA
jgi:hypothetical protein